MCDGTARPSAVERVATLLARRHELLAFVERRVGNRELAEEILQSALVKNLDRVDTVRETVIGWFYRVLRNAIVDHRRRAAAEGRRLHGYASEREATAAGAPARDAPVCACVGELAATLKPAYADALRRIEIEGVAVKTYADEIGITRTNAAVRVHRAREALRKQVVRACGACAADGCVACTCGSPGASACDHG